MPRPRGSPAERCGRRRSMLLSRGLIALISGAAVGSLVWQPHGSYWIVDIALRSYLGFLGTVMAHEAAHGLLGRSRRANAWWGRVALVPVLVPFTNFRKTHGLHHAHTNDPERDPDYFIVPRRGSWELPLRALAMPHHWYLWLRRRGRVSRRDHVELALNYGGLAALYGALLASGAASWSRLALGLTPPLVIVSLLLWYPFAYLTHEGHSLGAPEHRSHDYYGQLAFWFSLGLSLHRAHHLRPDLSWLELRRFVRRAPTRPGRLLAASRSVGGDPPSTHAGPHTAATPS